MAPAAPAAAHPAAHVQVAEAEPVVTPDAASAPEAPDAVADAFGFPIAFAFDSTEVLPASRPYLDSVGAMLGLPEAKDKRIVIVGHADAVGSDQYNQALSERRAATVRAYLETRFEVAADRLEIRGEGENQPLADTDPYAPQNRRVEFHTAG